MVLTKLSIITQLADELREWQALNLRPEAILGDLIPQNVLVFYSRLLNSVSLINTTKTLQSLNHYAQNAYNEENVFHQHFHKIGANIPPLPHFCATSLFQPLISQDPRWLQDEYDEAAQVELIKARQHLEFLALTPESKVSGVQIAAESGNHEMVAFLLHPEFILDPQFVAFDIGNEFANLLDNPRVTSPRVREILFRACALKYQNTMTIEMTQRLVSRMKTLAEWTAVFDVLKSNEAQRSQLFECCGSKTWECLIPNIENFLKIEKLVSLHEMKAIFNQLLSLKELFNDGHIILRLMDRMGRAERFKYVVSLGPRVNRIFSGEQGSPSLEQCMLVLGYDCQDAQIKLKHIHGPDELRELLPLIHALNQAVWTSTLDNTMKLQYFYALQQFLLAPADKRRAAMDQFTECVGRGETKLRRQEDTGRFFLVRWFHAILRILHIKPPFPLTMTARHLYRMVNAVVARSPMFHAVILDLNQVILPEEQDDLRRKAAVTYFSKAQYMDFWKMMNADERYSLLGDPGRFQQLLQALSDASAIEQFMRGLTQPMRDELVDLERSDTLITLLKMPSRFKSVLLGVLGEGRKNSLLTNRARFGQLLAKLPYDHLELFLETIDRAVVFDKLKVSLAHLQVAMESTDAKGLTLLVRYFDWPLPLMNQPDVLAELIRPLSTDKLRTVWPIFLRGREFSVPELTKLVLQLEKDSIEKCQLMVRSLASFTTTTWSAEFLVLLPHMTTQQQSQILSVISTGDLKQLIEKGQVADMMDKLTPLNLDLLITRLRQSVLTRRELVRLIEQLNPERLLTLMQAPPYTFLQQAGSRRLLGVIRQLRGCTDEQWAVLSPLWLKIGEHLFGKADSFISLMNQHVPPEQQAHVLDLVRKASGAELSSIMDFLTSDIMTVLMTHRLFDFRELSLERIRALRHYVGDKRPRDEALFKLALTLVPGDDADGEAKGEAKTVKLINIFGKFGRHTSMPLFRANLPILLTSSNKKLSDLMGSLSASVDAGTKALAALLDTPNTGLFSLMVPTSGFFEWYYREDIKPTLRVQWDEASRLIKELKDKAKSLGIIYDHLHQEKGRFFLKTMHEVQQKLLLKLDELMKNHADALNKVSFEVLFLDEKLKPLAGLKQLHACLTRDLPKVSPGFKGIPPYLFAPVETTRGLLETLVENPDELLETKLRPRMDEVEQRALLASIPDTRVMQMMCTGNELASILRVVTPDNARYFIQRCRSYFTSGLHQFKKLSLLLTSPHRPALELLLDSSSNSTWFATFCSLSPSSLKVLLTDAPKEMLLTADCKSLVAFVYGCQPLSAEQWQVLSPMLLNLGKFHFGLRDQLVLLFTQHLAERARAHVLQLMRRLGSLDQCDRFTTLLLSPKVSLLRQVKLFNELAIDIDAELDLENLEKDVEMELARHVVAKQTEFETGLGQLTITNQHLLGFLSPATTKRSMIFSSVPDFNELSIQQSMTSWTKSMDELVQQIQDLRWLFYIQPNDSQQPLLRKAQLSVKEMLKCLTTFRQSEKGKSLIKDAPPVKYGALSAKKSVDSCLQDFEQRLADLEKRCCAQDEKVPQQAMVAAI